MNAYKQHFLRMAIYNRWAFEEIWNKLDRCISDDDYHADCDLFFRSIHGTLAHLLVSSELWYARLTKDSSYPLHDDRYPYELNSYWSRSANEWEEAVKDRKDLRQRIAIESDRWIAYAQQLNPDSLMAEETIQYLDTKGNQCERNLTEALDHIFNHNTHHRGQISAAITKYGGRDAAPTLDISMMPKDEYNRIH